MMYNNSTELYEYWHSKSANEDLKILDNISLSYINSISSLSQFTTICKLPLTVHSKQRFKKLRITC